MNNQTALTKRHIINNGSGIEVNIYFDNTITITKHILDQPLTFWQLPKLTAEEFSMLSDTISSHIANLDSLPQ